MRGGASLPLGLLGGFENLLEASGAPGRLERRSGAEQSRTFRLLGGKTLRRLFCFVNNKKLEDGGAKRLDPIFL